MKRKLIFLIVAGLFVSIIFLAHRYINESVYKTIDTMIEEGNEPLYYFIDNMFVGSYKDNKWYSVDEKVSESEDREIGESKFYLKDIFNIKKFALYNTTNKMGDVNEFTPSIGNGLNGFSDEDVQKVSTYSENNDNLFKVPLKLGEECNNIMVPNYNFGADFGAQVVLATNATHNLLPRQMIVEERADGKIENALRNILAENQIKDVELNFNMILRGDFNNDGDYEKLVVANTKQEEEKSNSDIYSVAFIVNESGSIQVLYGQFGEIDIPDFCHYLSFLGAYDLDGDGKYEFGFKDQEWEWGSTFIIGQNTDGKWEVLLKSDWGM